MNASNIDVTLLAALVAAIASIVSPLISLKMQLAHAEKAKKADAVYTNKLTAYTALCGNLYSLVDPNVEKSQVYEIMNLCNSARMVAD